MRPNCYHCKYRRGIEGSVHSLCMHPSNALVLSDSLLSIQSIFASVGRMPFPIIDTGLNIKACNTGIKNGWFIWPFNFDPIWLENCEGFTEVADE